MWASARLHGAVLLLSVVCSVFNGGFVFVRFFSLLLWVCMVLLFSSVSNGHPIPYWQIVRSHSKLVSTVCSVPRLIFDRIMTDPNIHTQIRRAVILLL